MQFWLKKTQKTTLLWIFLWCIFDKENPEASLYTIAERQNFFDWSDVTRCNIPYHHVNKPNWLPSQQRMSLPKTKQPAWSLQGQVEISPDMIFLSPDHVHATGINDWHLCWALSFTECSVSLEGMPLAMAMCFKSGGPTRDLCKNANENLTERVHHCDTVTLATQSDVVWEH